MNFFLLVLLALAQFVLLRGVDGHVRIECPPPLSGRTGEKTGPCDVSTDDGSVPSFSLKPNALNTITWLESIPHPGAPVRFALSRDGGGLDESQTDFESCILLDHIPHDALSRPSYGDASTWHRSSITLWIPDVYCERCYLQLISAMSDAAHGVPADTKCSYKGTLATEGTSILRYPDCPAVYHSCSPVSIDGSIPRNEIETCNTTQFEKNLEWPLTPDANAYLYQHSVYYNRGDVGLYSTTDYRLLSIGSPLTDDVCTSPLYCNPETSFEEILKVPEAAPYTSLEGSCASILESKAEAYQQGGLLSSLSDPNSLYDDTGLVLTNTDNASSASSISSGGNVGGGRPSPPSIFVHSATAAIATLLMSSFLL